MFVSDLRKSIKNKDSGNAAKVMRAKASLIASFSSSHSWKTYEYLNGGAKLDKEAMLNEKLNAFSQGWTEITEDDVEEVMSLNISEYAFCMWLFYTMDKEQRKEYTDLFRVLKKEFQYGLEPVERIID